MLDVQVSCLLGLKETTTNMAIQIFSPGRRGRAGGLAACDPLALWERVQWKIVPTANPWQANYSFDPLGVCITTGGRGATHSGAQHSYV